MVWSARIGTSTGEQLEGAGQRWVEDTLGEASLYLTPEIAIHGTDHPEHLGAAISHGCIRMSNADVLCLYEELQVGAPGIIH